MSLAILGTGRALPREVTTNFDMAKLVDTSDEWIAARTGIRERRLCSQGENSFTLGIEAARLALEDAGVRAEDLTLLISHSVAPDNIVPSMACRMMTALGARCPAFDINAACTGFLYGMRIAQAMAAGPALIVCSEQTSKYVDFADRRTCVLFGDGAGAAVLAPGEGILHLEIRGAPDPTGALYAPGVNHRSGGELAASYMSMDGQEVFKFATREMMDLLRSTFEATGLSHGDFARILPHQANLRIIRACSERMNIPLENFYVNIDRLGNTSSAAVPIALDELRKGGELRGGDKVLVAAFGAGWTSGAAALIL